MAYINRTQLYLDLVQEILNKNCDIYSIDFIQNGLVGLVEENPILVKLQLDDNFQMQSELPDFPGTLEAMRTFLDFLYFYIQKLITTKDVEQRFIKIGEDFIQEHSIEILQSDLMPYFPTVFFKEKRSTERLDISSLREETPIKQVDIIYETLFTVYLQEAFKTDDRNIFFSEVLKLKKSFPILNQFLITKSGDVTIVPKDHEDIDELVKNLSDVFDYLVNFSSYHLGSDIAFKRAQEIIKPILDLLEDVPEKLGIMNRILKGALAKRLPTGITGFDMMVQGGIPRGKSVLIQAPQGSEKSFFISHFIKNCLENNVNLIAALGQSPPKIFKIQLKTLGLATEVYEKEGRFKIINWNSIETQDDDANDQYNSIINAEEDLSSLWRALEEAITSLQYSPNKCIVSNILSTALNRFEFDQVYNFIFERLEKYKESEITTIFLIEKDTHDPVKLAKLRVLFDGVVDIENEEINGKISSKIRILFMHETNFDPEYKPITLDGTKLIIS